MKNSMAHLGILLLTILFIVSAGSLTLFFTHSISNFFSIALGFVLLSIAVTFVTYLLIDLYAPVRAERQNGREIDTKSATKE